MVMRSGSEWNAEDIMQETYARALKYFKSYNGEALDQWIYKIAQNCLRSLKNNEHGFVTTEYEEDEMEGKPCNYIPNKIVGEVYELIETKSVLQQEVLSMHLKHGYSPKEISEITDYTYAVTHKIISRFKAELKELYG